VRACHIVPSLEARYGGPSKSVLGLARAMAAGGDHVDLLATDPGQPSRSSAPNLELRTFHRAWPGAVCRSPELRRALGPLPADVVHHHSLWLRTLHYAHRKARRDGVPLVVSPRGMMDAWAWRHHRRRKALARAFIHPGAFRAAAGWHATSDAEAEAIRRQGFRQPVCVAPNGVAAAAPAERAAAEAHWRGVLGPREQRPIALFYSRLHRKKRLLELIDLWLDQGPRDWLLLVVGIPEDYTAAMLDTYVMNAGQSGRVRAYDGSDQPAPYAVASLFVLPSHGENFGLSIAEALAEGVPALVTDTTPWTALEREQAGWCVPWAAFGAALRQATSLEPAARREMGRSARAWVLRSYSWERSARLLAEFYAKLRAGQPAPSR